MYVHTNQSVPWPTATEESLSLIVERAFFPGPWAEVVPSWFGGKMKNTSIHPWNIRNMYPYVANVSRTHDFFKSDGILGYPIFKPKWQRTCILDPESPWSWKLRYQTAHKIDDFAIEPSGHLPLMSDFSRDSRPCPVWSTDRPKGRRTFQCIRGSSVTNGSPVGWWFVENYATQYSGDYHGLSWSMGNPIYWALNTAQPEAIS